VAISRLAAKVHSVGKTYLVQLLLLGTFKTWFSCHKINVLHGDCFLI